MSYFDHGLVEASFQGQTFPVDAAEIDDNPTPGEDDALEGGSDIGGDNDSSDIGGELMSPPDGTVTPGMETFADAAGDVSMEELLADLLGAMGVHVEHYHRTTIGGGGGKLAQAQ